MQVDATKWGSLLLVALIAFIVLLIIGLFWRAKVLWLILSGVACLLFSAYLVRLGVCCVLCAVCCVLCAVCCVLCAVCCVLCVHWAVWGGVGTPPPHAHAPASTTAPAGLQAARAPSEQGQACALIAATLRHAPVLCCAGQCARA
jgi:hypothetical protein